MVINLKEKKMATKIILRERITIGRHTFELNDNCYECRGESYYDDDHDQVPEPSLQKAASILEERLVSDGHLVQVEHGEKGWIEVYITD